MITTHVIPLPDGRIVAFYDYDYTPRNAGSFCEPPTAAEVTLTDPWWEDAAGEFLGAVSFSEHEMLHEPGDTYDMILGYVHALHDAWVAAGEVAP